MRYAGRRDMLIYGWSIIAFCMLCIGVFLYNDMPIIAYGFIIIESATYRMTSLQAAWVFVPEVTTDSAVGVVISVMFFWGLFYGALYTYVFQYYLPNGCFVIFAAVTIAGVIFAINYVPETKHLTDKEKKEIMMPGATWGRPLREGEDCFVGEDHMSKVTLKLVSENLLISKNLLVSKNLLQR